MLVDEESHLDWLERQLDVIGRIGLAESLQEQGIG
jgi:bacterioferritin (cytochrome b1)